jgi:hypothetical protein
LTKQLFLLSSLKTSEGFFRIFVAFSEKLDFKGLGDQISKQRHTNLQSETLLCPFLAFVLKEEGLAASE